MSSISHSTDDDGTIRIEDEAESDAWVESDTGGEDLIELRSNNSE